MSDNTFFRYTGPDAMLFIQYAVRKLPGIWNSKTGNAAFRATFRRWHPDSPPSAEMQQHVWTIIFQSIQDADDTKLDGKRQTVGMMKTLLEHHTDADGTVSDALAALVNTIAVVAALRAVAGERPTEAEAGDTPVEATDTHTATGTTDEESQTATTPRIRARSLGHALYEARMTDLRMMRFMTTPREGRVEALHRALRLCANHAAHFDWVWSETRRIVAFLFGTEEEAQQSVNRWTADFLAARAHDDATETANEIANETAEPAQAE